MQAAREAGFAGNQITVRVHYICDEDYDFWLILGIERRDFQTMSEATWFEQGRDGIIYSEQRKR